MTWNARLARSAREGWRRITRVVVAATLVALPCRAVAQVAVVVNPRNGADDISADRLKRLFLGQATTFAAGDHARLALHVPSSERFDQVALGLAREMVRSRWMAMAFRGEAVALPVEYTTADDIRTFVQEHPDALAYLPVSQVDETMKVLRVDGKRPTDPGYPIK